MRKLPSNTWLGHSLKTILEISPDALSENSGYALLGNGGVPTPLLELAMVVLVILMRREESGGSSAQFAGGDTAVGGVSGGSGGSGGGGGGGGD